MNGAHRGQNHPLVAGRDSEHGASERHWQLQQGTLGRWQNSPVQTAGSTKVIQAKETEWENNAIKLMFDLFNLQCCFWLYRSVTCFLEGERNSLLSERWLEKSWQRPIKTTHHICLVGSGIYLILFNFQGFKLIQINKIVQDCNKSGPHMQIQHPDMN